MIPTTGQTVPFRSLELLMQVFILVMLSINLAMAGDTVNLLPPVPEPATNPHLATAFNGVRLGNTSYLGDAKDQDETLVAALAYLHPNSPYQGKAEVLDRLLILLNHRFSLWATVEKELGNHMHAFEATYAYLALKTHAPNRIPTDKKSAWEAAIARHTKFLIDEKPAIYRQHLMGALIVNMDMFRILSVFLGGLATGDQASAEIGQMAIEECMTKSLLGDGATHYANYSNEVFLYHNSIVWEPPGTTS